ncbi:MAG: ABC transporter permease [Deltaproteobacteria bacterium]|nr:ABC transporter permease [Deltaproteobacteria bacterium]
MNDGGALSFAVNLLAAGVASGTPLLVVTMGEVIAERSGVLNLGLEGLMLVGAMSGVMATLATGSALLGLLAAFAAAALLASLHALACISLRADQVVSGLSLGFLGMGLASVLGAPLVGAQAQLDRFTVRPVPFFSELPVLGPVLFSHNGLTYAALLAAPLIWWMLQRTRPGLHLRAVGENPEAADGLGVDVTAYRYAAVCLGGGLAGVGGAALSLALTPGYVDGMTAGMGWIALGLTIFARWSPLAAVPGALLFGAIRRLPLDVQGLDVGWLANPSSGYFLNMLPYLLVIGVLVAGNLRWQRRGLGAPASLGQPFVRGAQR